MASEEGTKPIRVGIIGCANIARKLSRAISIAHNAVIVAVASRSDEKAASFAAENNIPDSAKIYGTYEALLDDPNIDAVYLPLPTSLHVQWGVAAAEKGKHLLIEKPTAPSTADLDKILAACDAAGVQFMDGTMWMHHPRTAKMKELLSLPSEFGQLKKTTSTFCFAADPNFLENDIRVKPDLDALGALGDAGWYCVRSILWASNYELPKTAVAAPKPIYNDAGVVLSCSATLLWDDGKSANFHCSFLSNLTMDLSVYGSRGTLRLNDFVVPFDEKTASYTFGSDSGFTELVAASETVPRVHTVATDLPQEVRMVEEFARLVTAVKRRSGAAILETCWPDISRKTQLVIDAVNDSLDRGSVPVEVGS